MGGRVTLPRDLNDSDQSRTRGSASLPWPTEYGSLAPLPLVTPEHCGNRVEYEYDGITEWYENKETGLEHGFTIHERPTLTTNNSPLTTDNQPLIISGIYSGSARGRAAENADSVHFNAPDDREVLRYAKLEVTDAQGRHIPATMSYTDGALAIRIEDATAIYPIEVDPIYVPPPPSSSSYHFRLASQLEGDQEGAYFGNSVSGAGDVNGDGYADVLVGAPEYDNGETDEGAAFLFLGSPTGLIGTDPAMAAAVLKSNQAGWYDEYEFHLPEFGWSVSGAGDLNGDGYADVLVGAPGYSNGEPVEGAVFLFLGSPGGLIGTNPATAAAVLEGNQAGWYDENGYYNTPWFGWRVSGAGDVNGDGYADVIVQGGGTYVFCGTSSGLVGSDPSTAAWVSSAFGSSVSGAGDVNGDGYADVIGGAPGYENGQPEEGAAFLFLGSPSGLVGADLMTAAAVIEGNQERAEFGSSVSGAGDVNGDGYADVIVGAHYYANGQYHEGAAFLFLGSSSGLAGTDPATAASVLGGNLEYANFGSSVSGAGDVNGDGYADVVIGAPYYDNGNGFWEGAAFLFLGSPSGLAGSDPATAAAVLGGNQDGAEFGSSVSGAGDVNGDGYADVLVGAPYFDNGQFREGAVSLFLGSPSGLSGRDPSTAAAVIQDAHGDGFFVTSVSGAGDVNGDGYADIIVANGGLAFGFHGSSTGLVGSNPSTAAWALTTLLADSVSGAGDVNGDGYADVIVAGGGAAYVFRGSSTGLVGSDGSTAAWASSDFGVSSVSGVGDVNGDGYDDVVVGAPHYDNGQPDEGAAFLFLGSPTGLIGTDPETAAAVLESNQAGWYDEYGFYDSPWFGRSVSGAGDVNGDGYADVIVEGGPACVFYGYSSGLVGSDPSTAAWASSFGVSSVSGAGDVNGDGYDDVMVGAPMYDNGEEDEGAVFLFLGSPSGLIGRDPWTAAALLESNQAHASFGSSISHAGDVNADGYDDVLVGAAFYGNGELFEGAAFLFLGSTVGIIGTDPATAAAMIESNQDFAYLGRSVAGAGDVNGDGYADVIVDAPTYENGPHYGGAAFLFLGNVDVSRTRAPRLHKDDNTPIAVPGINVGTSDFRVQMEAANPPTGAMAAKLEWEVKPYGVPFDGIGTGISSSWVNVSTANYLFDVAFTVPGEANGFRWRAHILYLPLNLFEPGESQTPLTPKTGITLPPKPPHGPWFSPQWATVGPSDFRTNGYRPPTDPGDVQFLPGSVYTTDEIVCTVGAPSISPAVPPEPNQHEYVWTSNSGRTLTYLSEAPSLALPASETRKHEIWTCSVRGWDGTSYSFRSAQATAPEILNTSPGPPMLSLPEVQGKLQNLVCQVIEAAPDPDVDEGVESVRYVFDWYVRHADETSFALYRSDGPSTALSSQINNLDTAVDDVWYCMVTPIDNESQGVSATTGECLIVLGGVDPSYMSLGVNTPSITLGQAVTLSGQILPIPLGSGTVTFESMSPSGAAISNYPEGTVYASGYFSRSFYPNAASEGRAAWAVTTQWPGDDTYRSATSLPVGFEVLKAQPELAIALSQPSALVNLGNASNLSVTATFSVPGFPSELQWLYEGRTIRLSVADPSGQTPFSPLEAITDADGNATFGAQDFLDTGIAFAEAGVWKFKAEFAGDDNFKLAATADFDDTDARLTVKEGAGYAILVVGRLDGNAEGHAEHAQTAEYIYDVLRGRGFGDDDIQYLREYLPGEPDRGIADALPTKANLAAAIEGWAKNAILGSPAPLYIILLDHGSPGQFHMDESGTPELESLAPEELAHSIDLLESALEQGGVTPDTVVLYGACHSGSFIPALSGAGRVVITSSAADENSYRGEDINPDDGLDVRNGEFFLTEFFRNAASGKTLKECFELASSLTFEYTAARSNGAEASLPQHPQLDDNGDSVGSSGMLSSVGGEDGARVRDMDLGLGANAGNTVSWFRVSPSVSLDSGGSIDTLTAETTGRAMAEGDRAWLEIKTPEYDNGQAADPAYGAFQRVAAMVGPILSGPPQAVGGDKYQYSWSQADLEAYPDFGGFTTPGTYKVYYFLRDGQTNQVSSYLVTNIYVAQSGNSAPDRVHLQYPLDGAMVSSSLFFVWGETADPDGNGVTYRLEVSEDGSFDENNAIIRDGITEIFAQLTEADGIADQKDYHWRVFAVDEYGAQSEASETRAFHVDTNNGVLSSAIVGMVTDAQTGAAVAGATVSASSLLAQTQSDGSFALLLSQGGTYVVDVTALGYNPESTLASVSEGGIASVRVKLTPVSHGEGEGEPVQPEEGEKILSGTLIVGVTDASNEKSITDASVTLASIGTVTENVNGIYVFPAVKGGSYSLTVSAPGYRTDYSNVTFDDQGILGGEIKTVRALLTRMQDEGEGEGSGNNKFLGCGAGDPSQAGRSTDTAVLLGVLLLLMTGTQLRRPVRRQ